MWKKMKKIGVLVRNRRFQVGVGIFVLILLGALSMRMLRPPEPGIVATYRGGKVTKEELRRYLHEFLPRCEKHLRCSRHGDDHDSCTEDEQCETPLACGSEHAEAHTLAVYREAATSLVVDRLIGNLVAKKKLAERGKVRHLLKHAVEEINIADLHRGWHKGKIRVEGSEIKTYYEQNRKEFGSRTLSEVTGKIRVLLTRRKERAFIRKYLKELRENSGLTVNYDLLKYPRGDEEQLRTAYFEKRERFRLPTRMKLLLVEVPAGGSDSPGRDIAREVRILLLSGAPVSKIRRFFTDKGTPGKAAATNWVSEKESLWKKMKLARHFPPEVTDVLEDGDRLLVARVEAREEPRPQRFDEVREQLASELAGELRRRHLKENRNATLFTIHGEPYSLGDFMQEFGELTPLEQARYADFEARKKLLDRMVERSLVVEDSSDDLRAGKNRKRIDRVRLALLKQVLHQEEVDDKITVTDRELRDFFTKHKRRYRRPARVKINYLRINGGAGDEEEKRARRKAEKALAELKTLSPDQLAGDGFASVAKRYTDDPYTARTGGRIEGWIGESDNALNELFYHELHENVLDLEKGRLSPVFRMGGNFHVAFVRDRQEPMDRAFEEVRDRVRGDLMETRHYELMSRMESDLLRKAEARIYDYTLIEMLKEEARELQ